MASKPVLTPRQKSAFNHADQTRIQKKIMSTIALAPDNGAELVEPCVFSFQEERQ